MTILHGILGSFGDALASVAGRRSCWPKEQHFSQGAAEAQLRSLTRRDMEKNQNIHVYKCPECSRRHQRWVWHVGH